jgi:hypothetical protein
MDISCLIAIGIGAYVALQTNTGIFIIIASILNPKVTQMQ